MGLIARAIEAAGIRTLSMTSALSITRAVNPPRAAYLDYPLGHTSGKAHEPELNRAILIDALAALDELSEPGSVKHLPYRWRDDDAWKDRVMRPDLDKQASKHDDDRVERFDTPQWQLDGDRLAAEAAGECETCVSVD